MLKLHLQYHVHIILVACEDLEGYKRRVLGQVSAWLECIHSRRNQHTVIIQVTSSVLSSEMSNISRARQISRTDLVLERLQADFGGNKNNHIIQLRLKDRQDESWGKTLDVLGDSIYSSFWCHVLALEDDMRRMDAQRKLPGWNFCTFFITKEALALAYESVGFLEDALLQYDELEILFAEVFGSSASLSDGSSEWIRRPGTIHRSGFKDMLYYKNTLKLRESIFQNESNLYDFCVYLFSCQLRILQTLKRPTEVLHRAKSFICNFCYLAVSPSGDFTFGRLRWSFLLSLSIIDLCDQDAGLLHKMSEDQRVRFLFARGEIFFVARRQVLTALRGN